MKRRKSQSTKRTAATASTPAPNAAIPSLNAAASAEWGLLKFFGQGLLVPDARFRPTIVPLYSLRTR